MARRAACCLPPYTLEQRYCFFAAADARAALLASAVIKELRWLHTPAGDDAAELLHTLLLLPASAAAEGWYTLRCCCRQVTRYFSPPYAMLPALRCCLATNRIARLRHCPPLSAEGAAAIATGIARFFVAAATLLRRWADTYITPRDTLPGCRQAITPPLITPPLIAEIRHSAARHAAITLPCHYHYRCWYYITAIAMMMFMMPLFTYADGWLIS